MKQQLLFEKPVVETVSPRLSDYDWIVVNTSAGKDSQCMLDVICEQAREELLMHRVVAVHCDLAEEEWGGTKELAEEQAKYYGVRFEVVKRKQGSILAHVMERLRKLLADGRDKTPPWPAPGKFARWCTSDHKRGPVQTLFTQLAEESRHRYGRGYRTRILNCMGMRYGESCERQKLIPFKRDEKNTNGRRVVDIWLPIFHWTLEEVWARCRQAGTKIHYAYGLGMPRVSCCFCIYAPKNALMLAGKHNPELLDRYCEVEEKTGFTFKKELALVDIREALRRGEEPGPVESWEM